MFKRPDYMSLSKHSTESGYDKNISVIPNWEAIKARIRSRDKICVDCGLPGEDVHHIDDDRSNNNDNNLQYLCKGCHNSKRTTKRFNKPNYMR